MQRRERTAQVVRNGIRKSFQFLVGSFQLGGAFPDPLFKFFVQPAEFLLQTLPLDGIKNGPGQVVASHINLGYKILRASLHQFERQRVIRQPG